MLKTSSPSSPRWTRPNDFAVDIQRDSAGEFFELRVPTHLSDSLDVSVMQSEPKQRHLLLAARKLGDKPQLDRFLCGTTNVNGSSLPCRAVRRACVRRWTRSNRALFVLHWRV